MARIRTVKPSLFTHEVLWQAEQDTGLPLRVAFIGLFTASDREGRFKWRPRELKLAVLPYDDVDFARVLDALGTRGFIVKYACHGQEFGCIPTFGRHQVVNNRETASEIPDPYEEASTIIDFDASGTRQPRVTHAACAGKSGREGKGREGNKKEGKEVDVPAARPPPKSAAVWAAYSDAYINRYGTEPVRNAKVNSLLGQLVDRIGAEDAPPVAAFYVGHCSGYYVQRGHAVDMLVKDAEKLRTEWATNRKVTQTTARQADRTASNGFLQLIEERRAAGGNS